MRRTLSLCAVCLALWSACGQAPKEDAGMPLDVLVSILPQRNFVQAVGGDHVSVHVIIPPGASPATYNPKPGDLVRIEEADVFFRIGHIGFEQAHFGKIRSLNPDMRVVDTSQDIELRHFGEDESHEHEHEGEERAGKETSVGEGADQAGGVDPHVWLSPPAVKLQVAAIARALAELDPEHADVYLSNARAYSARLDELHAELTALFARLESRTILVFHPAWGYFADAYGLEQLAIEQAGKDPTAEQLRRIIDTARRGDIKVIFVQAQFSRELAGSIAQQIDGVIVSIDPLAEDYITNLRSVGQTVHDYINR
jgi:zinc transport system substrate-binding protein